MIKPIDELIELNSKFGVDMLANLQLSINTNKMKLARMYVDINHIKDYNIVNQENTSKPSKKW